MHPVAGLHHVTLVCSEMDRTVRFYTEVLEFHLVKQTVNFDDTSVKHFYFGDRDGSPGTIMTFFEYPGGMPGPRGPGWIHHIALMVEDEAAQLEWKSRLEEHGIAVSPVRDRKYFKSIYFNDPDGVLLEIATRGPGFAVDEDAANLGEKMILPDRGIGGDSV